MKQIILFTTIIITLTLSAFAQKASLHGTIKGIDNADLNVVVLPLRLGETPISDNIRCVD